MRKCTHWKFISLVITLAAVSERGKAVYCSEYEVNKCVEPFEKYSEEINNGFFPDHDLETMKQICSDWRVVESCLDRLLPSCSKVEKLTAEGLKDAYDFVCSQEGLATYGKIHTCLGTPGLASKGEDCKATYTRRVQSASHESICRYSNDFLNCVDDALEEYCGREAADWQTTVHRETLRPLLNYIDCTLDGELSIAAIVGIVIAAVVVLVLIIVCAAYCCCRKKKRGASQGVLASNQTQMHTAPSVQAPPYYSYSANGSPYPVGQTQSAWQVYYTASQNYNPGVQIGEKKPSAPQDSQLPPPYTNSAQ